MKKTFFFSLFTVLFACQSSDKAGLLSASEFNNKMIEEGVQILDVRTAAEFEEGHIKNAVNIDIQSENFDEGSKALYKDLPVYVYCQKGVRSNTAASRLRELGFSKVSELEGGLSKWEESGLPVVKTEPEKIYESDTIPFEKAIMGDKLVLVDFNAEWCRPCKVLQPIIERLHDQRAEDVIVYSIDVDKRTDLAAQYQAERIPLIMLFKNGKTVHRSEGLLEESMLNQLIDINK